MSAMGAPGITQLTSGETNDLWPTIDSEPRPRLFYQAFVDTRPDPRLFMTHIGTTLLTDLTLHSGAQPRINPKGDSILFTAVNERTGKRDIMRLSDKGGVPENLTNTLDIDEFDPVWNADGSKIAYVSDRSMNDKGQRNYDIWLLDLKNPNEPYQVTTNGSWDDRPVFDPSENHIYFRSNRGGQWAIWRIPLR
jgi:Tol biopolymer transport system component